MLDLTNECLFKSVIRERAEIKSMKTEVMQSDRFFMLHKTIVNAMLQKSHIKLNQLKLCLHEYVYFRVLII